MRDYFKSLFSSRIGRLNYILGTFIVCLPYGILASIVESISSNNSKFAEIIRLPLSLFLFLVLLLTFVWLISLVKRRFDDIDMADEFILIFIPFFNIYFGILTMIKDGVKKSNEFGDAPSKKLSIKQMFGIDEKRK